MAEARPGPVAALLLNFRRPDLTLQCLQDLLAVQDCDLRVLVIDNGNGGAVDASLQAAVAAARAAGRAVELLPFAANLGYAAAMNHGIAWARERSLPYVLLLNNDLRLPAMGLGVLVAALANDPRLAMVGPTVLRPDGRVWAQGGELGWFANLLRLRGQGKAPAPATAGPEAVAFLPGACVACRTQDLVAVGGFDESYFLYWEDVDLCRRLARAGRIVWLPWLQVTHAAGQSSGGSRSPLRKFCMGCNEVRFLRQHGSLRLWLAFAWCEVLAMPLALLVPGGFRAGLAKARGIWHGLRGHRLSSADVDHYVRDCR